jgi:hypothetical protein
VELARLRGKQELLLDDMGVGHSAPQALEQIAAFFRHLAGPLRILVDPVEPFCDLLDHLFAPVGVEIGRQRPVDSSFR